MEVTPTKIPEVLLVTPRVFPDSRGFFLETYSRRRYVEHGIKADFVQDNRSRSTRGVLRGLHYQLSPGQNKLIQVVEGKIFDVAVDIRKGSPTYGKWVGEVLDSDNKQQLFIPTGFAHGFCVLSDVAEVEYKVDTYYDPNAERGIAWDDPEVGVDWPCKNPILSDRDLANPSLASADNDAVY